MPSIKRWAAINVDFWTDPEITELRLAHGLIAAVSWQQMLLRSALTEGQLKGDEQAIATTFAGELRTTKAKVLSALEFADNKGWLASRSPVTIANYRKYNKTREKIKTPKGNDNDAHLPTDQPTNRPKGKSSNELSLQHARQAKKTPRKWREEEMDIYTFLKTEALPQFKEFYSEKTYAEHIEKKTLSDPDWWAKLSVELNGFDSHWVGNTLTALSRWMKDNRHRRPQAGFRRWIGARLVANYEREQRRQVPK